MNLNREALEKNLKWIVCLLVLFFIFFAIYFIDEPLNKDLQNLLSTEWSDSGNKKGNAYYYFLGFNAPISDDAFEVGLKLSEIYKNSTNLISYNEEKKNLIPFSKSPLRDNISIIFRDFIENGDFKKIQDSKNILLKQKKEVNYLFERLDLIKMTTYFKTLTKPHDFSNGIITTDFLELSKLELLLYLLDIVENRDVIEQLTNDITIYHQLLANSDNELLSITTLIILRNYYTILDILISNPQYQNLVTSKTFSNQVNTKDNFDKIIVNDLYQMKRRNQIFKNKSSLISIEFDNVLKKKDIKSLRTLFFSFSINENRMANLYYQNLKLIENLTKLKSNDNISDFNKVMKKFNVYKFYFPDLNNKLIYCVNLIDLDTYIDLMKLKLQIKQNHISPNKIQDFVISKSDKIHNPYTSQPIYFDSKRNLLFFEGPIFEEYGSKFFKREVSLD